MVNYISFADDTNVFLPGPNIQLLIDNVDIDLGKISKWMLANRLSLNVT